MSTRTRQLPGGGRGVEIEPARLAGWFERFGGSHEGVRSTEIEPRRVVVRAGDGACAAVAVPFADLPGPHGEFEGLAVGGLVRHLEVERRIGVILVRRGAHSVGVAIGTDIEKSSTDRHLVQGRTKAGGWSQKRYARRRAGQARHAVRSAADTVAEVLLPVRETLDAVVLGGDRAALNELAEDNRLRDLLDSAEQRILDVAEPRYAVLRLAAARAVCVEVEVYEAER